LKNNSSSRTLVRPVRRRIVTYGDLADVLLGRTMACITRWTIIILNLLFTAGLYIAVCENFSAAYAFTFHRSEDYEDTMKSRRNIGVLLSPIVVLWLQIPWLQDMTGISALGLIVYVIGVMGGTLYSAVIVGTISPPTDIWSIKWDGVPSFVGSAVYALEGINLALPTAASMRDNNDGHSGGNGARQVVCSAVLCYGIITSVFAAVGYAGGLGGGIGTGLTAEECDVVTSCMEPAWPLRVVVQVALSFALLLTVPVMLYPTTEMLEVMLSEWNNEVRGECEAHLTPPDYHDHTNLHAEEHHPQQEGHEKNRKLRLFLAFLVVMLGSTTRSFTSFSGFVGAVGLTFAGFILPPLLYVRAMQRANLDIGVWAWVGIGLLIMFGAYNMVVGGVSSFKDLF